MRDLLGRVLPWVTLLAAVALILNFLVNRFEEYLACLTGF